MSRGINVYDEARLQNRNVADANAVNIVSPGIVTDGLVLHLDAGNRVSYPTSGTVLYDLTNSRNNGTLTNGPTFSLERGGGVNFDGTNDYITLGNILNFTSEDFSFEIAIFLNSLSTTEAGQGPILFYKGEYRTSGYYCQVGSDGSVYFTTNQGGANQSSVSSTALSTLSKPYIVCITRRNTSVSIYINGKYDTLTVATHTNPTSSSDNFLINAYGSSLIRIFSNIALYYFKVYNRALTPTEVEQNFNATRARFGI